MQREANAAVRNQLQSDLNAVMLALHNSRNEVRRLKKRRDELIMGINVLSKVDDIAAQLQQAAEAETERKKRDAEKPADKAVKQ